MFVVEELKRAIKGAEPCRLPEVAQAVWTAYGAGGLTDEQAEQLAGLIEARQGAARAAPQGSARALTASVTAAVKAAGRAPSRSGSRPRSPESLARRRRWAAAGYLPPALAAAFTAGEQAALAVVAVEVGKRGTCTLAIGAIAALAGVCATIVKRALRLARTMGLITVEERRVSRHRNDTNIVRVVSKEWTAWLRLRLPRSALAGGGGTFVQTTGIKISQKPSSARNRRSGSAQTPPDRYPAEAGTA